MTTFIPAYDTEAASCLEACRRIVGVHRRFQMPATFFIVGKILEASADEYRGLLDDPLFEIASHTYSHRLLRDHPLGGPGTSPAETREQILRSKEVIERIFPDRRCVGLRTPYGFPDGLLGAPGILQILEEAGYEYVSSSLWGPKFSLPAPLTQSFTYAQDGFPALREFPAHGWHENVLKGCLSRPNLLLLFPLQFPEATPSDFIKTPEEEVRFNNKPFIDRALREKLCYVSLIWHPWSLLKFDSTMKMLEQTFQYVAETGLRTTTFEQLHRTMSLRGSVKTCMKKLVSLHTVKPG